MMLLRNLSVSILLQTQKIKMPIVGYCPYDDEFRESSFIIFYKAVHNNIFRHIYVVDIVCSGKT